MRVPTVTSPRNRVPSQTQTYLSDASSAAGPNALAAGVADLAVALKRRDIEKKNEKLKQEEFEASKYYLQEATNLAGDLEERMTNADLGDPEFVPSIERDYTARHADQIEQLKELGYSKEIVQETELKFAALRGGMLNSARNFSQKSVAQKKGVDFDSMRKSWSQISATTPEAIGDIEEDIDRVAETVTGVDAVTVSNWTQQAKEEVRITAGIAFARSNPEAVVGVEAKIGASPISFEQLWGKYLKQTEGGYVANDGSSGAPANFGINQRANPDIDVKNLTEAQAKQLYIDRYWKPSGADKLTNGALQAVHMDSAVNIGVEKSKELLAKSGNNVKKYLELREAHYRNLATRNPKKHGSSLKSWLNRNADLEKLTAGMGGVTETATSGVAAVGFEHPVLSRLSGEQFMRVQAEAHSVLAKREVENRAVLDVQVENISAARLAGESWSGPVPTKADFIRAHGALEGEQRWEAFEQTKEVGTFVKAAQTMSSGQLQAQVEQMKPVPGSSTYAVEAKAYEAAQRAAGQVLAQRKANPYQAVMQAIPELATAFEAMNQPGVSTEQRQRGYAMLNRAYEKLGIAPAQRQVLPPEVLRDEVVKLQQGTPEQTTARMAAWRQEMGPLWGQALAQLNKAGMQTEVFTAAMVNRDPNFAGTAADIIRGKKLIQADPTRKPKNEPLELEFRQQLEQALPMMSPAVSGQVFESAKNLYALRGGDPAGTDTDIFRQALRDAWGGGALHGRTILPAEVTPDEFDNWKDTLRNLNGAFYANGKAAEGKDVADEGNFVMVTPGYYAVIMESDDKPLLRADGRVWTTRITAEDVK